MSNGSNRKPSFWDRVLAATPPLHSASEAYTILFDQEEATRHAEHLRATDPEFARFVQSPHFVQHVIDHVAALEKERKERFKQLSAVPRHVKDREDRRKLERQNNKRR